MGSALTLWLLLLLSRPAVGEEVLPPVRPVPVQPAEGECRTTDVRPGVTVGDCYGVLLPRAYVINYEALANHAELVFAGSDDVASTSSTGAVVAVARQMLASGCSCNHFNWRQIVVQRHEAILELHGLAAVVQVLSGPDDFKHSGRFLSF